MRFTPRCALLAALAIGSAAAAGPQTPLESFPYTPGLDTAAMDRTADACVDFYQYACGGWIKANPIPPDQSSWDVYRKLADDNQRFLWGILDGLARRPAGRNANQARIGDYFAACMDEEAVEKRGIAPLRGALAKIDRIAKRRDLAPVLADLHLATGDAGLFFGFGSGQDYADATRVIAFASAGGLGLPDRDYYLKDDERSKELRAKYVAHVARTFGLLGEGDADAQAHAAAVMRIETALAAATLSRVDQRDPYKLFHKMDRAGLEGLVPAFDWKAYLARLGAARVKAFNVTQPAFFQAFQEEIAAESLADLRAYLRWHVA
ncbi:MAG TPA: M13 family metallopeptidase N-terminal domain-containing protein, partial [Usitatibacter sp.]|nr:M13 family metallopeptidase N-terminal domain-containing protein [Usitatibacter sp.]